MAEIQISEKILPGPAYKNVKKHPNKVYISSRFDSAGKKTPDKIHDVTWSEADRVIRDMSKGLIEMGFERRDRLAVFSPNRPRWVYSCFAAIFSGGVHVPIYPTSKEDDVWWILHNSGARFVVCGSMEHAERALAVKDRVETLEGIFLMDPLPDDAPEGLMSFDSLLEKGRASSMSDEDFDKRVSEIEEDDLAAIIYTSGTTGRPKGVMLTHKNFVAQRPLEDQFAFTPDEVLLAHLPMCHSFGFSADLLNSANIGAKLFIADSLAPEDMKQNLADVRPTYMASVPRLWEKFYIQIGKAIKEQPPLKQKMVGWAMNVGQKTFKLKSEGKPVPFLLEKQNNIAQGIFQKVLAKVGMDRLKYSATGGGPINQDLIIFFGAMGVDLYQGFGLTETAPIITANSPKYNRVGTVGKPLPNVQVKINDDGEVMIKAPQVMKGYWENPEATAEVLDDDGWFVTGDIGELDPDGFLRITDRKKELLITSGGKNIAPQPIENEFNTDPYIETVCAIGDNRKFISAIVVPDFENVREWLKEQTGEDIEDKVKLLEHEKVRDLIEKRIADVNKKLAKYEQIKKYTCVTVPFSEEGGELTPSQKKKRRVILEKYEAEIDKMYPKD